ncbi:membrane protein [Sulfurifustis variabilis]|uniref:Membrane protein n=1 Tax=Sulfurifustis variabilis TaxID=1675686 RepID=A0A1B4V6E9_9GAMM|nr:DUF2269 domain-containing protein [Sulfurifustis variabilis]BAU49109.1 membrane protein [Sulfurifustis variabilis]
MLADSYYLWKTAHVVSASVLFGTGLGIAFFAWFGYRRTMRTGRIEGLRLVLSLTVIADLLFTLPAVVFQALSGFVLLELRAWAWHSPWSLASLGMFAAVGLLWLPVVAIQILMSREADRAATIKELGQHFHRRFLWWFLLGVPAFAGVVVLFFLMVTKALPVTAA